MSKNPEECLCACHTGRARHMIACCDACPVCGMRVKRMQRDEHLRRCPGEQARDHYREKYAKERKAPSRPSE